MYLRFMIVLVAVGLVSAVGLRIEQRNRDLKTELVQKHTQRQDVSRKLADARQQSLAAGASEQKLHALEEGDLLLPSPENPSRIVTTDKRQVH